MRRIRISDVFRRASRGVRKLRHRIQIQEAVSIQDPETGEINQFWKTIATVLAEVVAIFTGEGDATVTLPDLSQWTGQRGILWLPNLMKNQISPTWKNSQQAKVLNP